MTNTPNIYGGFVADSLANLTSGLGTDRDKAVQAHYIFAPLTKDQIEAAYRTIWIIRKAIDIPATDMTREWRQWHTDTNNVEELEKAERDLFVQTKVARAIRRGRIYGGAALFMGIRNQRPETPLNIDAVKKGDLLYLHVFNRFEITSGPVEFDPQSPFFGQPKNYLLGTPNGGQITIDRSRVIPFQGAEIPDERIHMDGWSDSIIQSIDDAVKNAISTAQGIATLVQEAKIDIIKVPDLMANLGTPEYTAKLTQRFGLANLLKSLNNMTLLDAEEEWDSKQVSFAQLPETLKLFLEIVCGAVDIPATRMLGQSPTGLNSSGESDLRNYYDRTSGDQNAFMRPALTPLDEVLIRSVFGNRPDDIYYEFNPLWQLSAKEKSEIALNNAKSTQALVASNILPTDVLSEGVYGQLIEDGVYPGIEKAMEQHKAANGGKIVIPPEQKAPAATLQPDPANNNDPAASNPDKKKAKIVDRVFELFDSFRGVSHGAISPTPTTGVPITEPKDE